LPPLFIGGGRRQRVIEKRGLLVFARAGGIGRSALNMAAKTITITDWTTVLIFILGLPCYFSIPSATDSL
jgi:hypothetical protein